MGSARTGSTIDVMHDLRKGCTDDAWMGEMTDVMHDVWMDWTDDAWMGAMTDVTHNVWMDCTDDAQTGAPKGITYDVLMDGDSLGFCAGNLPHFSPHNYRGFSTGLQQTMTS